jgi:hypothetical protein
MEEAIAHKQLSNKNLLLHIEIHHHSSWLSLFVSLPLIFLTCLRKRQNFILVIQVAEYR